VWLSERIELVALDVFQRATDSGQHVTRDLVAQRLQQLQAHRETCRCGLCGETVAKARPDRVFVQARAWQRSVAATRARAVR
jgi:hypothetical protein